MPTPHRRLAARSTALALSVAALVTLGACGSNETATTAPTTTAASTGPAGSASGSGGNADGAAVYARACASCHGANLEGTDRGPSHLSIVYEPNHHGDASFRKAIANGARAHHWGFGDMPPVPGLSPAEVDAVIAFIRAEQQRQGFRR